MHCPCLHVAMWVRECPAGSWSVCILMQVSRTAETIVAVGAVVSIHDARYLHRTRTMLKIALVQLSKCNSLVLFLLNPASVSGLTLWLCRWPQRSVTPFSGPSTAAQRMQNHFCRYRPALFQGHRQEDSTSRCGQQSHMWPGRDWKWLTRY